MGQLVGELAPQYDCTVAGIVDPMSPSHAADADDARWDDVDVAIDFTSPDAVHDECAGRWRGAASTSSWGRPGGRNTRRSCGRSWPTPGSGIVAAPNFSTGVVLFEALVARAAELFAGQQDFGAWLHEAHHAMKKDAPSGTALKLKRAMEEAGYPRPIDVSASRAGFIPGTHTIGFDGPSESITLTHTARDRGALRARRPDRGAVGERPARLVHDAGCAGIRRTGFGLQASGFRTARSEDLPEPEARGRKACEGAMRTHWTGVGTALVTPFTKSGDLDEKAVRRLGRRQIDAGIHFLVPCGTTGETPTLTDAERVRVVEILVDEARRRGAGARRRRRLQHARDHSPGGRDAPTSARQASCR